MWECAIAGLALAARLAGPASLPPSAADRALWCGGRPALIRAVDHSLAYLRTPAAATAYRAQRTRTRISRERVVRSLVRFRHLLGTARDPAQLDAALARDFTVWHPAGSSGDSVHFTGYYEPVYEASRTRKAAYRYPLFRVPDLKRWPRPHPTREQLEGATGLEYDRGPLRGHAMFYLKDRLEAFLCGVEGSARLRLPDGRSVTVAAADHTDWPYTSVGRRLVAAGKMREEELTQPALIAWFRAHPDDLDRYLPRNNRFIFFRETHGSPPTGSIRQALTAERSIATDKSIFPPAVLALVEIPLTKPGAKEAWKADHVVRFVLDQDAGSAIRGPDRVDLFCGSGPAAGDRSGLVNDTGSLGILLLRK